MKGEEKNYNIFISWS